MGARRDRGQLPEPASAAGGAAAATDTAATVAASAVTYAAAPVAATAVAAAAHAASTLSATAVALSSAAIAAAALALAAHALAAPATSTDEAGRDSFELRMSTNGVDPSKPRPYSECTGVHGPGDGCPPVLCCRPAGDYVGATDVAVQMLSHDKCRPE